MRVFGDRRLSLSTRELLDRVERSLADSERDAAREQLLLDVGDLWQGLADSRGRDEWDRIEQACALLACRAARLYLHPESGVQAPILGALRALARLTLPPRLSVPDLLEGYAHYAVFPT